MASYDVSISPAAPAFSIRRTKLAPLPMQLHKNDSPDKGVYTLGPLTSDPFELATAWNECQASMGNTLIGHHPSNGMQLTSLTCSGDITEWFQILFTVKHPTPNPRARTTPLTPPSWNPTSSK